MKSILHIDMDAFFISCETLENPALRNVPAAVAGEQTYRSGIILSANYIARSYGVKTTMLNSVAQSLCPDIILVPPHRALYETYSKKVMQILREYSDLVEPFSIDEAWVDVTNVQHLFGSSVEIARKIKNRIKDELGLQCSIGISCNKYLSKMASDMQKPDGLTVLEKHEIPQKLWRLPVEKLIFVGSKSAEKLNRIGIFTIGDLASAKVDILLKLMGKYGETLHAYANGEGDDLVVPDRSDEKSISHTFTLPQDLKHLSELSHAFLRCCEEVTSRLRQGHHIAGVVCITLRYNNFTTISRQVSLKYDTDITEEIYAASIELLRKHWNGDPVRLIGVSLSKLSPKPMEIQMNMFGQDNREKLMKLNHTIDNIRKKYGEDSLVRSSILKKHDL